MRYEHSSNFRRAYLAIVGGAAVIAVAGRAFTALLASDSPAAPAVAPKNVGEPASPGQLASVRSCVRREARGPAPSRSSTASAGSDATDAGASDASDCRRITNAPNNTYVLREATPASGSARRSSPRNADGQHDATSNPTNVVTAAKPVNTTRAVDLGHGEGRQHASGEPRRVGRRAADHVLVRLASLQRQGRQLQRDPGRERHELRGARRRYGQDDPRPRHRP